MQLLKIPTLTDTSRGTRGSRESLFWTYDWRGAVSDWRLLWETGEKSEYLGSMKLDLLPTDRYTTFWGRAISGDTRKIVVVVDGDVIWYDMW